MNRKDLLNHFPSLAAIGRRLGLSRVCMSNSVRKNKLAIEHQLKLQIITNGKLVPIFDFDAGEGVKSYRVSLKELDKDDKRLRDKI